MHTFNFDTTNEKLKQCPFCGNPVVWHHTGNSNTRNYKVVIECHNCGVKMQIAGRVYPLQWLEEKILEKWNNRYINNIKEAEK